MPHLQDAWQKRNQRKIPESVQFTLSKFDKIWIVYCSVLEALFQKIESLKDAPQGKLAGKIGTIIDLKNLLPVEIWFCDNPRSADTKWFSCTYGDKFYLSSKAASKRDLKFSKLVKPYP